MTNFKIALTGHTEGIGKIIYENYDCIGFSRSNGYDLTDEIKIKKMLESIEDCNVFINNAFCYETFISSKYMFMQTEILYNLYQLWKNQKKLIINMSSNTVDGIKNHVWPYSASKAALDKANEQLMYLDEKLSIVNLKFGNVDTERIRKIVPKDKPKIPLFGITTSIDFILKTFSEGLYIKELCIIPK